MNTHGLRSTTFSNFIYRAMLRTARTMVSQDVCPSHAGTVSKLINISSNFFHRRVATLAVAYSVGAQATNVLPSDIKMAYDTKLIEIRLREMCVSDMKALY